MKKKILVFNAGSATLKFGVFDLRKPEQGQVSGIFERIGLPGSILRTGKVIKHFSGTVNFQRALQLILEVLALDPREIKLIGHRVVHGGPFFRTPMVVTPSVWRRLSQFNDLAPLHNPVNLSVIKACYRVFPGVKNVAVFDTAFFSGLTPENYLYALPFGLARKYHIRRYGFHGVSHEAAAQAAARRLGRPLRQLNLVTVHLGSGCSITAIAQGKPIKTSLGFTPLEGIVMGTRPGDLDAAIPFYLEKKLQVRPAQVYDILNTRSGLYGLSGFTSDMREILRAAHLPVRNYLGRKRFSTNERRRARLAFDVFMERLREFLLLYTSVLGNVDAVVFTGAIGERSAFIRRKAMEHISRKKIKRVLVVASEEELAIAKKIKHFK